MRDHLPPAMHSKIVHAYLRSGGLELAAADWMHPARAPQPGNMVAIYFTGSSYAELRPVFDKLAEGAPGLRGRSASRPGLDRTSPSPLVN